MKKIFIIYLIYCCISCTTEKKENMIDVIEKYKNDAILKGDDYAYGSYIEYAENNSIYLEKLSLSLIMNHKHGNIKSYYQIFKNIIEISNDNKYKAEYLENLNSANKDFALYYLKEGAKKNSVTCQETLEFIYRKGYGVEKSFKKSDSIYSILEKHISLGKFYRENKDNKHKLDKYK